MDRRDFHKRLLCLGLGAQAHQVDDALAGAAANVCDEEAAVPPFEIDVTIENCMVVDNTSASAFAGLSATLPYTSAAVLDGTSCTAQALTMRSGCCPRLWSYERRSVLPSMATTPSPS